MLVIEQELIMTKPQNSQHKRTVTIQATGTAGDSLPFFTIADFLAQYFNVNLICSIEHKNNCNNTKVNYCIIPITWYSIIDVYINKAGIENDPMYTAFLV